VSKLTDADGEAAETQNRLAFAMHFGYLPEADGRALDAEYETIRGGLANMMARSSQWCGPSHLVKEHVEDYVS
jgi:hypothetical protein